MIYLMLPEMTYMRPWISLRNDLMWIYPESDGLIIFHGKTHRYSHDGLKQNEKI